MTDETARFSYHRAVAPIFWAWLSLATLELVVVHLLVALWRPRVAVFLSAVTAIGIAGLVAMARSFKTMPALIDGDRILLRAGRIKAISVAFTDVAGLSLAVEAAMVKRRETLNLALLAYPNVVIELTGPRPGRRGVRRVMHRLDDPAGFAAAVGVHLRDCPVAVQRANGAV